MVRIPVGSVKRFEAAPLEECDQPVLRVSSDQQSDIVRRARIAVRMQRQGANDGERNSFPIEEPANFSN
jgi:hypothetical protein